LNKSKVLLCAVCACFIVPSLVVGQQAANDSPIVSGNVNPALKAPITLTAKEASLSEVLRVLADRSGMNFVVGEGVQREKITIILNNTPLDESINLLVRASGLSYEIIGNSILIAEPDKLKEDVGLSSYVVELKYATAKEVAAALGDLTKNIKIDEGGNRLICFASPRVIMEIERIVRAIDKPHILVMLETRLIEVSQERLNQYGIDYGQIGGVLDGTSGGAAYLGTSVVIPSAPVKDFFKFDGTTRGAVSLNAILNLIVQNGDGRVLMDSKLTTTNNRKASLHIGEVVPYAIQSYNLSSSGGVNQQIIEKDVGTILTVTPHINDKNQITLLLEPEVSNIVRWQDLGPSGLVPLVRTRKTSTTVRVEDGQTVILAGLLSETKTTNINKVPILGDIPLLGLLFQSKRESVEKSNLIIEVVPRIIHDPAEIAKYMSMQILTEDGTKGRRRTRKAQAVSSSSSVRTQQPAPAPAPVAVQPAPAPQPAAQPTPAPAPAPVTQPAPAPAVQQAPAQPAPAPQPAPRPAPAPAPAPAVQQAPAQPAPATAPASQPARPQPAPAVR